MKLDLTFSVKSDPWLANPKKRWNFGLVQAGLVGWKGVLQKYPRLYGPDAGGYKRTGALGNKATFSVTAFGEVLELLGTFYTKYMLYGTGIYGPRRQPIRPVRAKFLAWHNTGRGSLKTASGVRTVKGKFKADKSKDQYLIFAREVRGTIWEGKLDEIRLAMARAFNLGIKRYKEGMGE